MSVLALQTVHTGTCRYIAGTSVESKDGLITVSPSVLCSSHAFQKGYQIENKRISVAQRCQARNMIPLDTPLLLAQQARSLENLSFPPSYLKWLVLRTAAFYVRFSSGCCSLQGSRGAGIYPRFNVPYTESAITLITCIGTRFFSIA